MVRPKDRTHSKKSKRQRTPGGKLKVYKMPRKKTVRLSCANCGKPVHGTKIKGSSKTEKRPSRKFPELCAKCSKSKILNIALEA
ncbi:MAG TPA: hypothetical protein ENN30_00535 [Candidatus Woesearchaeota archaeon]|nr:hypothetical protein [Candidatus Woesearchaeota archaeon]